MHIGNLIKQKFNESGMTITRFAARIHCTRQNIYSIFQRENVELPLLNKISNVLDFDFLNADKENSNYLVVLQTGETTLQAIETDKTIKIMYACKV